MSTVESVAAAASRSTNDLIPAFDDWSDAFDDECSGMVEIEGDLIDRTRGVARAGVEGGEVATLLSAEGIGFDGRDVD